MALEAPEDITEDPVAPDLAVAIIGPRWVEGCTTDLPWVVACIIIPRWAVGIGPIGTEAAAAVCFP